MSSSIQKTISLWLILSPIDGSVVATFPLPDDAALEATIQASAEAFRMFKQTTLDERMDIVRRFLKELEDNNERLAQELTAQIGRPTRGCRNEIRSAVGRGEYLLSIAKDRLSDISLKDSNKPDHVRYIQRLPVGPVLIICPWNYPFLCQVNAVVAAILAGCTVLLKPSPQTPLSGEAFRDAFIAAGLSPDVLQVLHITPDQTSRIIKDHRVKYVMFTGSVQVGHAVVKAAADSFKGVGLELGGKDPAYVRPDADLDRTVLELVDGAFYNCGQSCCAVERIYVHKAISDSFVSKYVEEVKKYKLGDPRNDASVTLGPVISKAAAQKIRKVVRDAEKAGAKPLIAEGFYPAAVEDSAFVAPQVLVNVNHSMALMKDETFGPVIGIQVVNSDEEAVQLMNDSDLGLTASVWTKDEEAFKALSESLEAGTIFQNGCDYLDPHLPWSGTKDSGRGISMSQFAFDAFTQTKGVNRRIL